MGLDGLRLPGFLGWINGLLFVSKPWGELVFASYVHPYTLFAIGFNIVFGVLWHDFYSVLLPYLGQLPLTLKIAKLSGIAGFHYFNAFTRWIFLIFARRISRLLVVLHKTLQKIQSSCGVWKWGLKSLWVLLIFQTGLALTWTYYFKTQSDKDDAVNSIFFPHQHRPWWYFVIFFFLATFPTSVSVYFTAAFIFVTTYGILRVFQEFCNEIMDEADVTIIDKEQKKSRTGSVIELMDVDGNESSANKTSTEVPINIRFRGDVGMVLKVELLDRFDKLKDLFDQYDIIMGPLLLGMLIRIVFVIINDVTEIMVTWDSNTLTMAKGCAVLNLCGNLAQFSILELGDWTERKMNKWKLDLERMIILMPATSLKKDHLSDVIHQVSKWKWQMSAWGFFYINRQLMSGIVATMMSYIVILFQLHVAGM